MPRFCSPRADRRATCRQVSGMAECPANGLALRRRPCVREGQGLWSRFAAPEASTHRLLRAPASRVGGMSGEATIDHVG